MLMTTKFNLLLISLCSISDPLSLSLSRSPKAMAELKQQIEKERVKLRADKNMVMEERNEAHLELEKKEEELRKAQ